MGWGRRGGGGGGGGGVGAGLYFPLLVLGGYLGNIPGLFFEPDEGPGSGSKRHIYKLNLCRYKLGWLPFGLSYW